MRKKIQIAVFMLLFSIIVSQGTLTVHAETEGSAEGGTMVVTQEGNASSDTTLSSLKIAQASLNPKFDPDQLTYTATVPYEVTRVALTAQTSSPDAKKIINGTSDLEVGENTITVTVVAQNGSTREYRIFLIREEMPETSSGSEGGETSEVETDETQSEETTAEMPAESENSSEGESSSENAEQTTASEAESTTQAETIMIPPDTEANGGMVVETDPVGGQQGDGLISKPMLRIILLGAICLVSVFAIVAAVIARREDDDDEDDEEEGEDELTDDDLFGEDVDGIDVDVEPAETLGEAIDEDFEEIIDEIVEEFTENDDERDAPQEALLNDSDDDLDDDFEMLLEEDDDFDFLDF